MRDKQLRRSECLPGRDIMPRVLDDLPKAVRGNVGRSEKYPFDEWFDGNVYELVEGEDFDSKRSTLATVIHNAATKRDLIVQTRMTQDGIAIQARPLTKEDKKRREEMAKRRAERKAAEGETEEANGNGKAATATK
jgi:hypothetical protein